MYLCTYVYSKCFPIFHLDENTFKRYIEKIHVLHIVYTT